MKRFSLVCLAFLLAPPAAFFERRRSVMIPVQVLVEAFALGRSSQRPRRRNNINLCRRDHTLQSSLNGDNRSIGSSTSNGQDQSSQEVEYRSISDYVGGLHGGKYEFDPRLSGITSLNYEKSVVFGDVTPKNVNVAVAPAPDETPPKWASRPVDYQAQLVQDIRLAEDGCASVVLVNAKLSWEPFYASLEMSSGEVASSCHTVMPSSGNLASRGGTNKYSDQVILTVKTGPAPSASGDPPLYLVARTECDAWVWRLILA